MANLASLMVTLGLDASGFTNGMQKAAGQTQSFGDKLSQALTFTAIVAGFVAVEKVVEKTINEYQDYVKVVHDLSVVTGQSTEDTSKAIQVADDLRISQEQLTNALGIAAKKGIDVSIKGLEVLAEKYNALGTAQEKAAFLGTTFGRSGLVMGEMMAKGATGIDEMSKAIEKGLIVTNEAYIASRQLAASQDVLDDSIKSVENTIVTGMIPTLGMWANAMTYSLDEQNKMLHEYGENWALIVYQQKIHNAETDAGMHQAHISYQVYAQDLQNIADAQMSTARIADAMWVGMKSNIRHQADEMPTIINLENKYSDALKNVTAAQKSLKAEQQTYLSGVGDKIIGNLNQWATATGRNDKAMGILDARLGTHYLATSLQDRAVDKLTTSYNNGQLTLAQFDEGVQGLAKDMPTTSSELEDATAKAIALRDSIVALAGQWGIRVTVDWSAGGGPGISGASPDNPGSGGYIDDQGVPHSYASGGFASGWALVGETGPELVNMGSGGQVYSNAESKGIGGMSGEQVSAIVGAVLSTRIDYNRLARAVRDISLQSGLR